MEYNINSVKQKRQCCSCGICAGVCSRSAISMEIDAVTGELLPIVCRDKCSACGLCLNSCPGLSDAESVLTQSLSDYNMKQRLHLECYLGYINDGKLIDHCVSGGIVSELVRTLLSQKIYDSVFFICTNQYSKAIETEYYRHFTSKSCKSRYVAVSHGMAVKYLLSHREERIILIATGCAVNGFRKVIESFKLNTENYLLIGLFCDTILSYKIWNYFCSEYAAHGDLTGLDFRNKKDCGWPGDMLLHFHSRHIRIDRSNKHDIQAFFKNERCLYCTNKLNESADISVGDNHTGKNSPLHGSSSIIVRTPIGKKALGEIRDKCILTPVSIDEICKSQKLDRRASNRIYAKIKYLGVFRAKAPLKDILYLGKQLLMIKIGRSYCRFPTFLHIALKLKKLGKPKNIPRH